jgi:hypothetical protein
MKVSFRASQYSEWKTQPVSIILKYNIKCLVKPSDIINNDVERKDKERKSFQTTQRIQLNLICYSSYIL